MGTSRQSKKPPILLKQSILLIGTVGVRKSALAEAVAGHLGLQAFDPEEALRQRQKARLNELEALHGLPWLRTKLLDLILPVIESQPNSIVPCPAILASHPDFQSLVQEASSTILLESLPLTNYTHVVARESHHTEDLWTSDAKIFFYHRYWMKHRQKLKGKFHVRVQGELDADSQAICQKILAIQELEPAR